MASTFSTSLRLELIGDGDQSGIWGQTTNTNLGTLLEQAVTGVRSITMLDATYTMSNYNGVSDESRNAVLVLGGTNTAQRNLVAPLVNKLYIVKNSTTGGFGVQIIGATGTGVVIPNGTTASVYCDGTNFYAAQVNTVGNQIINGNLTVTGTTTLTGATTMSSALTYGGVALSNSVTGTGSMVLSASPTLTGSPIAPTQTAGDNSTKIATTAYVGTAITNLGLGTMSTQNANAVAITGGTIDGTTLGATTAASVRGTTGTFTGALSAASASFTAALPVLSGGTGVTTSTGTGSTVLSVSPTFTGTPLAPTATTGTNTTQLATTAFVQAATTALGLGTMATQNANAVAITGGTIAGMTSIAGGTVSGTTATFSSTVSGTTITASTQFSGPGTGLTGTATSLSIGGNAATATSATTATTSTNVSGGAANRIVYQTGASTTSFLTAPTTANTTLLWSGSAFSWTTSGAPLASGCIYENGQTITSDYTMTTGNNGQSAGPITIDTGVTVTIPDGSYWVIN